ncbi:VWA domain-containing protein [Candidatus Pacearchaeota archaeon]|nr:MAG: VWA domain-containing protein [Candidatus Pacearchaeota archaeon]
MKRGLFFSVDALIALVVILIGVLIVVPFNSVDYEEKVVQKDIIRSLSALKIGSMNSSLVQSYLSSGIISDPNKSVLEQIGEFYVLNKTRSRALAQEVFNQINTTDNIGIWFGNELISSRNKTVYDAANSVIVDRQVISGIQEGQSVTAYSARAVLNRNTQSEYYYFGGYIGEGNISLRVFYRGDIRSAILEIATKKDFDVYVNGNLEGSFTGSSSDFIPKKYQIPISHFSSGENLFELRGDNLNVQGGFLRIDYQKQYSNDSEKKYYFPGIEGAINLYDGLDVHGTLKSMNLKLHLKTNFSTFLSIGNVTVFNGTTNGIETNITIPDSTLSSNLDYGFLSNKTIPIRLGFENASYVSNISRPLDTFSVTDLSGSMNRYGFCKDYQTYHSYCDNSPTWCIAPPNQGGCGGVWYRPIDAAKDANKAFIDAILNSSKNRVGLVGYSSTTIESASHDLSSDANSLKATVDSWSANGMTCICCGINSAVDKITSATSTGSLAGNLMTYYPFEDSVEDLSGKQNNATIHGSPTYQTGSFGKSLEFNGATDYIEAGRIENVTTNGTIAFWFRPRNKFDKKSNNPQGLWSKYENNSKNAFISLKGKNLNTGSGSDGSIQVKFENVGGTTYIHTNKNKWNGGNWYHIAVTWGGGTVKIYVDGTLENTASGSPDLNMQGNHTFGKSVFDSADFSSDAYFDGRIDDVRVYDYELSPSQIAGLADMTPTCQNSIVETGEVCDRQSACSENGALGSINCNPTCSGFIGSCNTTAICGNGILNSGEECDDGNTQNYDGCSSSCKIEERLKSIVVMSDGQANVRCPRQNTGSASQDAIQAACDAYNNYGIRVYSVGFGSNADESTLQAIANCGNGSYYFGNISDIINIYKNIAGEIIQGSYVQQRLEISGDLDSRIWPDSYIDFEVDEPPKPFGILVTKEKKFNDGYGGTFNIPENSSVVEAFVVSYSGPRWTAEAYINNTIFYNLSDYGDTFVKLGDPYSIRIPTSLIQKSNQINLTTGLNPSNLTEGSSENKIIYTIKRDNIAAYSSLSAIADGCYWHIEFENNTFADLNVPSDYSGSDNCYYNSSVRSISNAQDAVQVAVKRLLELLDFDNDGVVDVKFDAGDMSINSSSISGIPYSWSTEMQVRTWN